METMLVGENVEILKAMRKKKVTQILKVSADTSL